MSPTLRLNSPASLTAQDGTDAEPRRVEEDGTEYLAAPAVAIQADTYRYPTADGGTTAEYLPAEELQATVNSWAGKPLLLSHPENAQGHPTVLTNGDAVNPTQIGEIREPAVSDDKLTAEAWIDLGEQGRHDGDLIEIVNALDAGRVVETSTGYLADADPDDDRVNASASAEAVQTNLRPDHLAVFPLEGERGNCSVAEGCGIGRANAVVADIDTMTNPPTSAEHEPAPTPEIGEEQAATLGRRVLNALGVSEPDGSNPDPDPDPDCTCDHENQDAPNDGDDVTNADQDPDSDPDTDQGADSSDAAADAAPAPEPDAPTDDADPSTETESMADPDETPADEQSTEQSEQEAATDGGDTDGGNSPSDDEPAEAGAESQSIEADTLTVSSEEIQGLREEIESLKEQVNEPKRRQQDEAAELVAEEFGVDASDVDLDTEAAQAVLNQHQSQQSQGQAQAQGQATANMAAVPGQVERENSAEDDVPVGGYTNWESRTNNDDNGGDN